MLSSNTKVLSRQQRREELSRRIAYYDDDLTIITWNAALVFGTNMEDVLTVLELANVQLRELHYLDDRLDDSLQESYDIRAQTKSVKASMQRIRELMLDGQAFSEAVTNAFKPFPDAFLARVYALASRAMGLNHFDESIRDKLSLLNTLYTTLSDEADHERSVRLEWIVIILIFIEIVMGLSEKLLPLFHRGLRTSNRAMPSGRQLITSSRNGSLKPTAPESSPDRCKLCCHNACRQDQSPGTTLMIAYPPYPCAGCRSHASREVIDDDGEPLPLCDRCPSPEEIQRRTAEVRTNWDELDYWSRRYGLPRDLAETVRGASLDEVSWENAEP